MTPVTACLPVDADTATLVGRVWMAGAVNGPCVVSVEGGEIYDLTHIVPTLSGLLNQHDPVRLVREARDKERLGSVEEFLRGRHGDPEQNHLLAPSDLQSIKACGVTFVDSMLERVVEEKARGNPARADEVRNFIMNRLGGELSAVIPGSDAARTLKDYLVAEGLWSQYLEVGLGPDAEVFTKAQPMSAIGCGAEIGLHPSSEWNNPEPELVLAVNNRGIIIGATLGNDVNLRDIEGRSALLLGRAKDNNGSCALGPFIRLIDADFNLDILRKLEIHLHIEGEDGFTLDARSNMSGISRDIEDLVRQVYGAHHQYPDGFMLFTGTHYSPTEDREEKGSGFTHKMGDRVTVYSPQLGVLTNTVNLSTRIRPWEFGTGALMENLGMRGYLDSEKHKQK